ncbi:DUF6115 domain-containing protein [Paenibacillus sp. GCM10027628]|uniref:DUF6115 domain-containing protein n=1 Tax=Paenibacillus sp. GCM10027628 TaxID=3273413 RepID=UPI003629714C
MKPLMYVVLLGLVIIVYARFIPKKEAAVSAKTNVVQEIEETIEHFAAEMDEQNQALLDLFSRTKQDYEVELAKLAGRLESLEKQKHELSQELTKVHVNQQLNLKSFSSANPVSGASIESISSQQESQQLVQAELHTRQMETVQEDPVLEPIYTGLSMKTRYAELFSLHDQGKSVEAIAKKLGMNKGEVSLILQLSSQEEKSRV